MNPLTIMLRPLRILLIAVLAMALPGFSPPTYSQDAPKPTQEQKRSLAHAKRAFNDHIYDSAITRLSELLETKPPQPLEEEARWLLAQAYFFEGRFPEALDLFTKAPSFQDEKRADDLAFFHAETLAALGQWEAAISQYQTYLKELPKGQHTGQASLGLAAALLKNGSAPEALTELQSLIDSKPEKTTLHGAQLLLAKIHMQENKNEQALKELDELEKSKPRPPVLFEMLLWKGELQKLSGKNEEAIATLNALVNDPRASPRQVVTSAWFDLGLLHAEMKSWQSAASAFLKTFQNSANNEMQQVALQRYLDAHRKNNSLSSGAIQVRDFVAGKGKSSVFALYALAQAFQEDGNLDAAISELDNLVRKHPDSEWTQEAQLLMADIFAQKEKLDAAISTVQKLVDASKEDSEIRQKARYRLAELLAQNQQFEQAALLYQSISESASASPLLEKSLYNALLAFSEAGRVDAFTSTYNTLMEKFPTSKLLDRAHMEQARLLFKTSQDEQAIKALEAFIEKHNESPLMPRALWMLGSSLFHQVRYQDAVRYLKDLETGHPTSDLARKAQKLRIEAQLRSDAISLDEARSQLETLASSSADPSGPDPAVLFQIAETYFAQQNFGGARTAFAKFAEQFPDHELTPQSLYYSGRSLMGLGDYEAAVIIFEKIPEAHPFKGPARLAEIDCYLSLAKYEAALKIADSLTEKSSDSKAPPTSLQTEAHLRKAICFFTMASTNPDLYPKAIKEAQKVITSPGPNPSQLNRAGFILGKSYEHNGKPQKALNAYLDVVYGMLLPQHTQSAPMPEYRWFARCGAEAARIKEESGDIQAAISIYEILERLSGPNREEFRRKILDLRTRHFILPSS